MRDEEAGAFAAGAEAHLTGQLEVCAGSCGPGKSLVDAEPLSWNWPLPMCGVDNQFCSLALQTTAY
jgi:hypothetical protein